MNVARMAYHPGFLRCFAQPSSPGRDIQNKDVAVETLVGAGRFDGPLDMVAALNDLDLRRKQTATDLLVTGEPEARLE